MRATTPPSDSSAVTAPKTISRNAFEKWLKGQHARQNMAGQNMSDAVSGAAEADATIADAQTLNEQAMEASRQENTPEDEASSREKYIAETLDPANILNFIMLNVIAHDDFHTGINKGHLSKNDLAIWLQKQHHHDQQDAEAKATIIINRLRENGAVTDNGTIDINKIHPYQMQNPGESDQDYRKRIVDARWNLTIITLNT